MKDLHASLAWYRDVIGFTVGERYERNGTLQAVELKAGAIRILIGQDDFAKGKDRVKGTGISLQFTTAQPVDDVATRVKGAGGTLERTDGHAVARVFRVRDPDGFILDLVGKVSAPGRRLRLLPARDWA